MCVCGLQLKIYYCNRTDEKYASSPGLEPGSLRLRGERSPDWANRAAYTQFTSTRTYPSHSRYTTSPFFVKIRRWGCWISLLKLIQRRTCSAMGGHGTKL